MQEPSVAPVVPITLGGETHTLKYGFRAYKELDLNPFDPESVKAFVEQKPTIDVLARQIWAGLLHEYAKGGERHREEAPTLDDIIDALDMFSFVDIWTSVQKAIGVDEEKPEPKPEGEAVNPPQA